MHQRIDPVCNPLRRLAQLPDRPVGGVALGHVAGPGMVDQPLGQRARQHQFALRYGNEGIAQAVEPEFRPAGLRDAVVVLVSNLAALLSFCPAF